MTKILITFETKGNKVIHLSDTIYDALKAVMAYADIMDYPLNDYDAEDLMQSLVDLRFNGALPINYDFFHIEIIDANEDSPR